MYLNCLKSRQELLKQYLKQKAERVVAKNENDHKRSNRCKETKFRVKEVLKIIILIL